ARVEGIWAGPTGVAALATLTRLLAEGRLDPGQRFWVVVTETGLKTEATATRPVGTAYDYASLRRLVGERLAQRGRCPRCSITVPRRQWRGISSGVCCSHARGVR